MPAVVTLARGTGILLGSIALIQTSWYERSFARPPRPARNRAAAMIGSMGNAPRSRTRGLPVERSSPLGLPTPFPSPPAANQAVSASDRRPWVRFRRSGTPDQPSQQGPQPLRSAPKSSGRTLQSTPKKIDTAVALLRAELARGERPAAEVEAKALCIGISPRTYYRTRKRRSVTSRGTGLGLRGKYMIALPVVDETPSKGANMAGAT